MIYKLSIQHFVKGNFIAIMCCTFCFTYEINEILHVILALIYILSSIIHVYSKYGIFLKGDFICDNNIYPLL